MNYMELHKASMTREQAVALYDFLTDLHISARIVQGETEDGQPTDKWALDVPGATEAIWDFPAELIRIFAQVAKLKADRWDPDEQYLVSEFTGVPA